MIYLQQSGGSVFLSQLLHFLLNGEPGFTLGYISVKFFQNYEQKLASRYSAMNLRVLRKYF